MRIISGKFGGRKISPVPGTKTRPITDKVRESLFNMIEVHTLLKAHF